MLGVGEIEKQKQIEKYHNKDIELHHEGKNADRVALLREAISDFPNDLSIISALMYALRSTNKKEYNDEIIAYGERLLDEATDNNLRSGAIQTLCFAYKEKGDIESAKKYANMANHYHITVNELMPHLLEADEAVIYCQSNIQSLAELICHNASLMLNKGEFTNEERIRVRQFVIDVFDLLFTDGNCGFFHCRYSELYTLMARNNKYLGRDDEMFFCLEKAAEHAIKFDTIKDGKFTSFMADRVSITSKDIMKNFAENRSGLLLKALNGREYAAYIDNERLKNIIACLEPIAYMG